MSSNALWEHLKTKLLNANYTVYIRNAPNDAADAIRAFTGFVEQLTICAESTAAPERIAVKNGFPTTVGDGAVTVELAYQIVGDRRRNFVERRPKPQTPKGVCAASSQDFASDFADGVLP